jgi:hypothetical protein
VALQDAASTAFRGLDGAVLDDAEAAVTLRKPERGCPEPVPTNRRASEVLATFSTRSQLQSYEMHGYMSVVGSATGERYRLYHRDAAAQRGLQRCLIDTHGNPVCVYDWAVPAEEETLAIKFAVEHAEPWIMAYVGRPPLERLRGPLLQGPLA